MLTAPKTSPDHEQAARERRVASKIVLVACSVAVRVQLEIRQTQLRDLRHPSEITKQHDEQLQCRAGIDAEIVQLHFVSGGLQSTANKLVERER